MKKVVYRMPSASQTEYKTTPERFKEMQEKHGGQFVFVREEDEKDVRKGTPTAPVGKVERVGPAPKAPRQGKKERAPKEVRTPKYVAPAPESGEEGSDEPNSEVSGS